MERGPGLGPRAAQRWSSGPGAGSSRRRPGLRFPGLPPFRRILLGEVLRRPAAGEFLGAPVAELRVLAQVKVAAGEHIGRPETGREVASPLFPLQFRLAGHPPGLAHPLAAGPPQPPYRHRCVSGKSGRDQAVVAFAQVRPPGVGLVLQLERLPEALFGQRADQLGPRRRGIRVFVGAAGEQVVARAGLWVVEVLPVAPDPADLEPLDLPAADGIADRSSPGKNPRRPAVLGPVIRLARACCGGWPGRLRELP